MKCTSHSTRPGHVVSFVVTVLAIIGVVFIVSAANLMSRPVKVKPTAVLVEQPDNNTQNIETETEAENQTPPEHTGSPTEQGTDPSTTNPATSEQTNTETPKVDPQIPVTNPANTPTVKVDPASVEGGISLEAAYKLYEEGALFIDTRHTELFNEGSVAGAFRLTVQNVTSGDFGDVLTFLQGDPEQIAVIYCSGGECDESVIVREKLVSSFPNLKIMVDGFPAWKAAGYPVQ
ncbi:MAG: hypothetical protein H6815_11075 [Phycisphaeraceae bacterium]|nr:hypothetical protein [Phycisphaerales bacterium]MCB9860978.1 hypothetical protein [Phycisphaeraceae bacterium]